MAATHGYAIRLHPQERELLARVSAELGLGNGATVRTLIREEARRLGLRPQLDGLSQSRSEEERDEQRVAI